MSVMRQWLALALLLLVGACAPYARPTHLEATAGAAITVDGDFLRSPAFRLRIPEGWRVITGEAQQALSVLLVSPDNCQIIQVSLAAIERAPVSPSCQQTIAWQDVRIVSMGEGALYVAGSAPDAAAQDILLGVIESIE
jgi:hypothetical protein